MANKERMMNKAEESVHRAGGDKREKPAASKGGSEVGNERHTSVKSAQTTGPESGSHVGNTKLSHAVEELHKQHPHEYHDHGPHHGTTTHQRHEPLHGLKPHHKD